MVKTQLPLATFKCSVTPYLQKLIRMLSSAVINFHDPNILALMLHCLYIPYKGLNEYFGTGLMLSHRNNNF